MFPNISPIVLISEFGIDTVANEIEIGRDLEIKNSLGVRFVAVYEAVKKGYNLLRCDLIKGTITPYPNIIK